MLEKDDAMIKFLPLVWNSAQVRPKSVNCWKDMYEIKENNLSLISVFLNIFDASNNKSYQWLLCMDHVIWKGRRI